ncbi:MAG: lipopolysaccharide heptosyltransferase I [Burkholderiales bacterium]|nr:lipopolysaccharide heptosyltransferase I [Burkholderiales bacterium]
MRILIVKLSSLGDVVHTMPVVHDILAAHPGAVIDWVVEPGFAPLLRRVQGIGTVIECALRRWSKAWWMAPVRAEWRAFRARLRQQPYDAVIDLQGLTKSAVIARLARGTSYGLANQTEGASHEWPARWLVDHAISVPPRIHAMDRARVLVGAALHYPPEGAPRYGLRAGPARARRDAAPTVVFVHGTSRDDKLWPQSNWVQLGKRFLSAGWSIALPQGNEAEQTRAELIAAAWQFEQVMRVEVWPSLSLDAVVDRLAAAQGVIGVDSGLSHIAVALDLPHVQLYNFPTAWRTGPQAEHGHRHQVSVEGQPIPSLEAVWSAWSQVTEAARE